MAGVVIPVAKALYLCEEVDTEGGLTNLYGLFKQLRASAFPYVRDEFVVFAQLLGGLGEMTVHLDVRRAADGRLVHPSLRRTQLVQISVRLEGVLFDQPSVYLVELYCDNVWVADVSFEVLEDRP